MHFLYNSSIVPDMLDFDSLPLGAIIDLPLETDRGRLNISYPSFNFPLIPENSLEISSQNFADSILLDVEFEDVAGPFHHSDHFHPNRVVIELELDDLQLPSLADEEIESMMKSLLDDQETSPPLDFSFQSMEIDHHLSLHHLCIAYGEAMDANTIELANVIRRRISEKVSPYGDSTDRVLFYLFGSSSGNDYDYIIKESYKNFGSALEVFNQLLPYVTFCNFEANSAILESMPQDYVRVVRIFDFDIEEGVQWSSLIETLGQNRLFTQRNAVKLTSIKWHDDSSSGYSWRFEETKARLEGLANENGVNLEVNEVELKDLEGEVKKKTIGKREWLVFNCMLGFPKRRRRRRSHAMEFLKVAQSSLSNSIINNGMVTFVDGDRKPGNNLSGFGSYFEKWTEHYGALLESVEMSMPRHLGEARIAMEALFMAPFMSMEGLRHEFEEAKGVIGLVSDEVVGMEGLKVSNGRLMEGKEMVRECETLYRVRVEGENMLVLEWRDTPLIRISSWK